MAKKVLLQDWNKNEILPITRGELILDSSGKEAFHSKEFLATTSLPGLMSNEDKTKLDSLVIDTSLSTTSTNPVQNKVITTEINNIKKSYLKSATVNNNTLTIVDQSNNSLKFYNTTYNTFSKETSEGKGGNLGLVPIPNYNSGSSNRYLREDGTWVKPDNTTYTFEDGTNGFTVTSSSGEEFINVIPNIANNVIYSGTLVDKQVAIFDGTSGKIKASGYTIASNVPSGAKFTDTTYSNGEGLSLSDYIFSLKKSSTDKLGGIKITKNNTYTVATHTSNLSLNITTVDKYYGVELDSTGKAFVYVPWLNTEYSLMDLTEANTGTATTARTISAKVLHDKIKSLLPSVMTGATSSSDGESGLVPKPVKGNLDKYLKGDGSWGTPLNNKVTLTNTTNNAEYRVLFSESANDTTSTEGARKSTNLKFNPNTGTLTAITFNGNLDWSKITNKPTSFTPSAHTHPTNQINALTEYSKAEGAADLATTDTLNTALGKLEYKADAAYTWYKSIFGPDTDEIINKYDEIVDFVDSVKEGSDITDEFVTRKTKLTVTGAKTFSLVITSTVADGTAPFTITSGTLVTNLNADKLDGFHASGLFLSLSNIASTDTSNPNTIAIKIGDTTKYLKVGYATKAGSVSNKLTLKINSGTSEGTNLYTYDGSNAKTLDIKAGSNITLTPTGGVLTISATNTTYTLSGVLNGNTFETILTPSSGDATKATVPAMTGATASAAGKAGLVPAPGAGKNTSFLRGDGTWAVPLDTKVTSADNHYTPEADSTKALGATASSTTSATWGSTDLITGIKLSRDAKGHVTGITVDSIQLPSNPNVNTWRAIQVNDTLIAGTGTDTYALNFVQGTGITISGAAGSSSSVNKITITNSGVRSVTIGTGANANKLAVNTNGTTAYLTIPYAVKSETATKLSTTSKTAWGLTYWTSEGIPTSISGDLTNVGDVVINTGDSDKYIYFSYDGTKKAGASWRTGMVGTGSANANYFVIESGTNNTSAATWNRVLQIGQNNYDATFSGQITATKFIGTLNNTLTFLGGTFKSGSYNNSAAKTINIPTNTSHLKNDSGFLTELPDHTHDNYFKFRGWVPSNNANANDYINLGTYLNGTGNGSGNSNFPTTYGYLNTFGNGGSDDYRGWQLHISSGGVLQHRACWGNWTAWRTVLDSVNYTSYITTPGNGTITITLPGTNNLSFTVNLSGNTTITLADTKNTAGATNNTSNHLYIIGATELTANPLTYSRSNVYISLESGTIVANGLMVTNSNSGGSAKGMYAKNDSGSILGGVGILSNNGAFTAGYIGWGDSPYNEASSLRVNPNYIKYKGYTVLHSNNSSVSATANSITVKINGESKTLTIPTTVPEHNHDIYVKKSGDTITGSIVRAAGGSWIYARDFAVIKQTSLASGLYNPVVSVKTTNGSWSMGTLTSSEKLIVSYDTDSDYKNKNNVSTAIYFPTSGGTLALTSLIPTSLKNPNALTLSAGTFTTKTYDGSTAVTVNIPTHTSHLTNNSGFITINHTHNNYLQRLQYWAQGTSHDVDDLLTGITFAYQDSHNTPSYGTVVSFSALNMEPYALLLLGDYTNANLYFRNKNGNNQVWNNWAKVLSNLNYTDYVNTTNFPGLYKTGTVTSIAISNGGGIGISGSPITSSGTITISNAGVRSVTIGTGNNSNKLAVNTNGTTAYLTIPYATNANIANTAGFANQAGSADTADILSNSRIIALSGAVTGSATFNGGANITIATSVNHTHSYLPLTGGTLTGSLTVGNKDANELISIAGNTSQLKMMAWTNATYIESGNSGFTDNVPLHITGYNANLGSTLYLDFNTITCRGSYTNIDSGNWSNYITIPTVPTLYERNLGVNGKNWTFSSPYNTATTTIYAPTSAGTSGQVLVSTGGTPIWKTISTGGGYIGTTAVQATSGNQSITGINGVYTNYSGTSYGLLVNNQNANVLVLSCGGGLYVGYTNTSGIYLGNANSTSAHTYPLKNNTYYLGNSSLYWKEVTANIFKSYGGSSTWAAFYLNSSGNTVFENSSGAFYINSKSLASLKAASNLVILGSGTAAFYPNTTLTLGTSGNPWSAVYAKDYYVRGSAANTTAKLTSDAADNIYLTVGGIPMLVCDSTMMAVRSSMSYGGRIHLGTSNYRWNYVYATHLNAEGGKFYTDANGAYWTSDIRLKTNIIKARNLDIADLLVEFDWKDSGNHSWGYIAQDLLEVLPEAVSYSEDTDRYSVNYNVAHSAAIASLTARIKELEEKLKKYGIL